MSFPLFRLDPKKNDIFRNFHYPELFNISLTSRKSFQLSKQMIRKNLETTFQIDLQKHPKITVGFEGLENIFTCKNLVLSVKCDARLYSGELHGVPYLQTYSHAGSFLDMHWDNEQEGFKKLTDHLLNLNDHPQIALVIDLESKNVLELVEFVVKGNCISFAEVYGSNDKLIRTILDQLKPVYKLYLNFAPGPKFRRTTRNYEYYSLKVNHASWVTWPHLLTFNSREIELDGARLSSLDLNLYLKKWLNGACPNVEKIELKMNFANVKTILADIPSQEQPRTRDGRVITVSYTIRRSDGATGTISTSYVDRRQPDFGETGTLKNVLIKMIFSKP